MNRAATLLALAFVATPAPAHRLDEYLQATLVSLDSHRMETEMTLTPGVAVFPFLIPDIDANGDGILSDAEQRDYATRVLADLSILSDGHRLTPQLTSLHFPTLDEMKEGRGEIRLTFTTPLPAGYRDRELTIENRHHNRISAYLVNCLVPRDPHIQILAQNRNNSQSLYRLEYRQTDQPPAPWWSTPGLWLTAISLLLIVRYLLRPRQQPNRLHHRPPAAKPPRAAWSASPATILSASILPLSLPDFFDHKPRKNIHPTPSTT